MRIATARATRRLTAFALAPLLLLAGTIGESSASTALVAGDCVVTLNVSYSPEVDALPGTVSGSLSGSGTCVASTGVGTVAIGGGFTGQAWSCESGVALGFLSMYYDVGLFRSAFPITTVALVNNGGVIETAFFFNAPTYVGAGALVQDPLDTAACALGGLSSTTWTGTFAFEDPVL